MIPRPPRFTLFPYTTLFRPDRPPAFHRDPRHVPVAAPGPPDRKSTRLNSSHPSISYAVFCLKKKNDGLVALDWTPTIDGEMDGQVAGIVGPVRLASLDGQRRPSSVAVVVPFFF